MLKAERKWKAGQKRICAHAMMPNHWHLLSWPECDGELTAFMQRLPNTDGHFGPSTFPKYQSVGGPVRSPSPRELDLTAPADGLISLEGDQRLERRGVDLDHGAVDQRQAAGDHYAPGGHEQVARLGLPG